LYIMSTQIPSTLATQPCYLCRYSRKECSDKGWVTLVGFSAELDFQFFFPEARL
jgi:hypothetical protein